MDGVDEEGKDAPPADFDLGAVLSQASNVLSDDLPDPTGQEEIEHPPDLSESAVAEVPHVGVEAEEPQFEEIGARESEPSAELEVAPQPTFDSAPSVNIAPRLQAPALDQAVAQYSESALESRATVVGRLDQLTASVEECAEQSVARIQENAASLRVGIDTATSESKDRVRAIFEDARSRAATALETRLEELRCANDTSMNRVLDLSRAHQDQVVQEAECLAVEAETLGEERATALLGVGEKVLVTIADHAGKAVSKYSGSSRIGDIRVSVGRLADDAAMKVAKEALPAVDTLREDGQALAAKLREDGEACRENIASGDEEIRCFYEESLAEAEGQLREGHEGCVEGLDESEAQIVDGIDGLGTAFHSGVNDAEAAQVEGVQGARDAALHAIEDMGEKLLGSFDQQMAEVAAFVASAEPGAEDDVAEALIELSGMLPAQLEEMLSQVEHLEETMLSTLTQVTDEAIAALDAMKAPLEQELQNLVTEAESSADAAVVAYDEGLGETVQEFSTSWQQSADERCATLDEARDESLETLGETSSEGTGELEERYSESREVLFDLALDTVEGLYSEAHRIENQSWWQRAISAFSALLDGIAKGLWEFIKSIGMALLILAAAIVLGILLVATGIISAVVLAVIAKVALIVGAVLSIIAIGMAIYNTVEVWRDPSLTFDEKMEATGQAIVEIASEVIPIPSPKGVLKLTRRTTKGQPKGLGPTGGPGPGQSQSPFKLSRQSRRRDAEFEWMRKNGYTGQRQTFELMKDRGLHFNQQTRRWSLTPDANTTRRWRTESVYDILELPGVPYLMSLDESDR